jgi:hypothetical protein
VAKKVFEEATGTALGQTCYTVISFHLKQKFCKEPCEVLVEDPKTFYKALEEIFGAGAESLMNLLGTFLTRKYTVNCTPKEFVDIVTKGDAPSKRKLKEILEAVAKQVET